MTFSFGLLSSINGNVSTVAFISTIVFLVIFDAATNALEASLKGSIIYNSMLQKIYKELMMMGFVSFIIAMFRAIYPIESEKITSWIEAADFVGYIFFFVAIFFVIHALYMMSVSMNVSRRYADLDKTPISDILVDFNEAVKSPFNMFLMKFRLLPVLKVLKNVEFKIGWAVFRDTYTLPSQFNYVEYVSGSLQRYALRLVDISNTSWLFVIMLVLLNYVRMLAFDQECMSGFSQDDMTDDKTEKQFDRCEQQHRVMFQLSGGFLVMYVVGLFVIGRIYQFRIIGRAGVLGVDDYANFLMFEEASLVKQEQQKLKEESNTVRRKRKSSVVVFKSAMEDYISEQRLAVERKQRSRRTSWNKLIARIRHPSSAAISPSEDVTDRSTEGKPSSSNAKSYRRSSTLSFGSGLFSKRIAAFFGASKALLKTGKKAPEDAERNLTPVESMIVTKLQSRKRRIYNKFRKYKRPAKLVKQTTEQQIKFSEDLSAVFFWHSPHLFFKSVEIAILMNSLFLSIWFCNYMTRSNFDTYDLFLVIIPIFTCFPVIGEVVKTASLIDCTAKLNLDVVGTIIEDLENKQQLKKDIHERLQKLGKSEESLMAAVTEKFNQLATEERPDEIDEAAFRKILKSLKLFFSDRKFATVMHHTDTNGDGFVSRRELNHFLFPENEAQCEVLRRDLLIGTLAATRNRESAKSKIEVPQSASFRSDASSDLATNIAKFLNNNPESEAKLEDFQ